jgi:tRNA(Arg) A34 adenosine deaminase TadA
MNIGSIVAGAHRAVELAEMAAARGTFGVGGVLLGPDFEPLHECENGVVEDGRTRDPTAHVERQLIDWYFVTRHAGAALPPPQDCTIVSSLDPCMQCAGAILAAGFRCLAIAPDPIAGVHYAGWGAPTSLPKELRAQAARTLGSFAVMGERGYCGPDDPALAAARIAPALVERARNALAETLETVQRTIAGNGLGRQCLAAALAVAAADCPGLQLMPLPDRGHQRVYRQLVALAGAGDHDSPDIACFLDHKNALAAFARPRTGLSPIRTAVMELIRNYAELRWRMMRGGLAPPSHPKDCVLYTLDGPGHDVLSVMALGAVGSTLEGPIVHPQDYWRYFRARQQAAELAAMVAAFPPLYSEVIRIVPAAVQLNEC